MFTLRIVNAEATWIAFEDIHDKLTVIVPPVGNSNLCSRTWFMRFVGTIFLALALNALFLAPPRCEAAQAPTIAVLDFEIEDDTAAQGGVSDPAAQRQRLDMVTSITRQGLADGAALQVVDNQAAQALIARTRALQSLHTCNGCELDIGRALGADLVLVGWVQKVSNLILNINAGVKDVRTGRILVVRSVDMRGNTNISWERAARRLAQQIRERLLERLAARPPDS